MPKGQGIKTCLPSLRFTQAHGGHVFIPFCSGRIMILHIYCIEDILYIIYLKGVIIMMPAREARVTQWGTSLGIRLPKEFTDLCNLKQKSVVRMEIRDGTLLVMPIVEPRKRKPLAEVLASAQESGAWDGTPAEITAEDRIWLDSPSVGAEVVQYD